MVKSNKTIGYFVFDFGSLYKGKGHIKEHMWFALLDGSDNPDWNKICGYVKCSAVITGVSDDPVELKMDMSPEEDSTRCVIPATIKPKFTQLKINFYRAEHLPKLDVNITEENSMDAYIRL